ncbi:MAG: GtrA family protein [Alicyclobacillus sp.]|nr:GtrA family protein [Alicyclobacillus sp.]
MGVRSFAGWVFQFFCRSAQPRRGLRFLAGGAGSALVDYGVLAGLTTGIARPSGLQLACANTLAVLCALLYSYLWNRHWTFAATADGSRQEKRRFVLAATVNLAVNNGVLLTGQSILGVWSPQWAGVNVAKWVAMALSSIVMYALLRGYVFKRSQQSGKHPQQHGTQPSPSCECPHAR